MKVGLIINNWKLIEPSGKQKALWLCIGCNETTRRMRPYDVKKGVTKSCGCQSKSIRENTNLERYGVKYLTQKEEIQEKIKSTNLIKYGQLYYLGSIEQQKKARQTCIDKYGVEYFSQTQEYKESIVTSNIEKYGLEHYLGSNEHHQKVKEICLEKYGVTHHKQRDSERNKLRDWCEDNIDKMTTTLPELEILEWIRDFYSSAQKIRKKYELDIFIPELNLGIEYNGLYHHSEARKANNYHLQKTEYFKKHNIRIIHIWAHEWTSRKDQVKSFLLSAINKNKYKIGARKCSIVWSCAKEEIKKAHQLLDETHIQGHTSSTKYVANIYFKEQLLATATFGKHHRNSKEWVLTRFTTKTNYTIQGILSKISKLANKKLDSDIISWADYRLSDGNGYKKAGWLKEKILPPDYFYWNARGRHRNTYNIMDVISKQSRQKSKVKTPDYMTEHEHALKDGLLKIYDCGKIRYRLSNDNQ